MLKDAERAARPGGQHMGVAELIRATNEFVQVGQGAKAVALLTQLWESGEGRTRDVALALTRAYDSIGEPEKAHGILRSARETWPGDVTVEIACARREIHAGGYENACQILAPWLGSGDGSRDAYLVMADAQLKLGRTADALDTLAGAEARFGATPLLCRLKSDALVADGRDADALSELRNACSRWPSNDALRRRFAARLLKAGRFEAAARTLVPCLNDPAAARPDDLALFADACLGGSLFAELAEMASAAGVRWPEGDRWAINVLSAAAALRRRDLAEDPRLRLSAPLGPAALSAARSNAMRLAKRRRLGAAAELLDTLLRIDPSATALARLRARLYEWQGEDDDALRAFESLRDSGRLSPVDMLDYATFLSQAEDPHRASSVYASAIEMADHPGTRARARIEFAQFLLSIDLREDAATQLDQAAGDAATEVQRLKIGWLQASLGDPDRAEPVVPSADEMLDDGAVAHFRYSDDRCVVWFGGVSPANLGVFQAACLPVWRRLGISVITVTDLKRLASLQGFGRDFPDREAAQQRLAEILRDRGYARFAMQGTSLSGYAAILYGCRMGAAGALSFSGINFLPSTDEMDPSGLLRLKRVLRSAEPETFDLKPLLAANPEFVVHQHFGTRAAFDVEQARHIDSLPGVRLFGYDHGRHASLAWLEGQGLLEASIEAFAKEVL